MRDFNLASFTREVKTELSNKLWEPKERERVLTGYILASKQDLDGNCILANEITAVIKLIYSILKTDFDIDVKIKHENHNRFNKHVVHEIILSAEDLKNLPFYADIADRRYNLLIRSHSLQGVLAGLFLKSATINDPSKGNYYLGIAIENLALVDQIVHCLEKLPPERKISFKHISRRSHYLIYLKKSEEIGNFLAYIGASIAMLNYENIRLTRDFYNSQNRLNVCDSANYEKSLKAGAKNIEDIKVVSQYLGLASLGEKAQKIIELRKLNADVSYTELTNIANDNNLNIGRSTVVKIFSDLAKLADKCRVYQKN